MRNKRFPNYPDDTDYNTNSPSYYDDLARKQKLMQLLAEKIWEYDDEIKEYFKRWEDNLENINEDVIEMMIQWSEDGTLDHIINDTIFNWKADKTYVEAEIERLDLKDEDLTTMKADKTFVDSEIERLEEKDEYLTEQLKQIETNVKDFGAKGDGVTDDTQAINLAIENTRIGGTVNFPEGIYMVDGYDESAWNGQGDAGIKITKPLTININGGATVKHISKSERNSKVYYGYLMFSVVNTKDVIFKGKGTIEGDRKEHIGVNDEYKGEHGTGIYINNSQNVVVRDLTIKDTWGDGIGIVFGSRNVTVDNVLIDHVRRNGITVTNVEDVNIINTTIKNVIGTLPQSGIDIEPNPNDGKANNITIANCYFSNNATQDIVFGGGDGCDNIFIEDCYFNTLRKSIVIAGNNLNSTAFITGCYIRTKNSVFTLGGFRNTYIENVTVESNIPPTVNPVAIDIEMNGFSPNIYIDSLKNVNNFFVVFNISGSEDKTNLNITNSSFSTIGNSLFRGTNTEFQIVMKHNIVKNSPLGAYGITVENSVFDNNQFINSGFSVSKILNTLIINNHFIIESSSGAISCANTEDSIISNNIFKVISDVAVSLISIGITQANKDNGVVRLLPNALTYNTIVSKGSAHVVTEPEDISENTRIRGGLLI